MEPVEAELLRNLLTRERLLSLGVLVDGKPVVGVLPFVVLPDSGWLSFIHASRLARHAEGLFPARLSARPFRLPTIPIRTRCACHVSPSRGASRACPRDETRAAREVWLGRFRSAAMTVELGGFAFWRLRIASGRLIVGFGRALNIGTSHLHDALSLR